MREEPPYFMSMVDLQEPSVNHLKNVFFLNLRAAASVLKAVLVKRTF